MSKRKNSHIGGKFDDFLKEEGVYEETQAQAIKEVVARQLAEAMKARKLSRAPGRAAQDEPDAGEWVAGSHARHHALEPATRGETGGSPGAS
jgi:hypothetical protein